jgi:hypothetical protein
MLLCRIPVLFVEQPFHHLEKKSGVRLLRRIYPDVNLRKRFHFNPGQSGFQNAPPPGFVLGTPIAYYWKIRCAKSWSALRQVAHSCTVSGTSTNTVLMPILFNPAVVAWAYL